MATSMAVAPGKKDHHLNSLHHHHTVAVHPSLRAIDISVDHGHGSITVPVPAHTVDEGHQTLKVIGGGATGAGLRETTLGITLPKIRSAYYSALEAAEREISAERRRLGPRLNNPVEFRKFVAWASEKRTTIARVYRLPAGPGAVVGGEIRDNLKYGLGGRTTENLVARNVGKGLTEEAAFTRVLATVDKPALAETEAILKGAKYLKGGGAVFFVGGAALTGYEIYRAKPEDRPELIKKEAVTTGGSMLATDLVVGVAFMVGVTGVGLIAVGLVAGVASAYGLERLYYAHSHSQQLQEFHGDGIVHAAKLMPVPSH